MIDDGRATKVLRVAQAYLQDQHLVGSLNLNLCER